MNRSERRRRLGVLAVALVACLCLCLAVRRYVGFQAEPRSVGSLPCRPDDLARPTGPDRPAEDVEFIMRALEESVAPANLAADWEAAGALEAELAAAGERAVPLLRAAFDDGGEDGFFGPRGASVALRQRAAWVLGQIGTPSAARALAAALEPADEDVRSQIILALGKIPDTSGQLASGSAGARLNAGQDKNVRLPFQATRARLNAGRLASGSAGARLNAGEIARAALGKTLLSAEESPELRSSAALLLAKRPEAEAAVFLAETARRSLEGRSSAARDEDDARVARWSVEALGFSSHPEVASPLLRELARSGLRRAEAASAAQAGQRRRPDDAAGAEEDEALRTEALRSLARLEGHGALDVLGNALRSDPSARLRREVVRALVEAVPLVAARSALEKSLTEDTDPGVRALAAGALGRPDEPEGLGVLESALSSEKAMYVRLKIVEAIGRMGGEEAEAVLQRIAESDGSAPVRGYARAALSKIAGPVGRATSSGRRGGEHSRGAAAEEGTGDVY